MDQKIEGYKRIIRDLMLRIERISKGGVPAGIESVCALDDERGNYLLLSVGWAGDQQGQGRTIFIRIKDGRVWIEDDWTDLAVVDQLMDAGIPQSDIVLGFQPPDRRKLTEFAVA